MCALRPLIALLLVAAAGPLGAANFRLSAGEAWSDVYVSASPDPLVTPDGRWLFYRQDADVDEAVELWRVPAVGGTPERISGLLPSGSNVFGVELTPDGSRVVFYSPQDDVEVHEIFSAPVGAPPGSYVKVNAPLPASFSVWLGQGYSPDSARAIYASYPNQIPAVDPARLWVARLDGSEQTPIVTLPLDAVFGTLLATPDFTRAVYFADAQVLGRQELWSVPVTGGPPARLNGALVAGGDVQQVQLSPAGTSVLYVADQQVDERSELYLVPVAGGVATKLNHALSTGRVVGGAAFTPDGQRILYVEVDTADGSIADLWSVAPDASGRVALVGAMVAGGNLAALTFDSDHVVFVADKQVDEVFELFSVPIAGGAVIKLSPLLPAGGDVVTGPHSGPKITPDGTRVVYAADQGVNGIDNLYSVPIGGGPSTAIGGAATFGSSTIQGFVLSPDGSRAARVRRFRFLPTSAWSTHLAVAPLAGGGWQQVDSCPAEICDIALDPVFSPTDPKAIFYTADQEADERWDLYAGDVCLLCDGFEVGTPERWSLVVP